MQFVSNEASGHPTLNISRSSTSSLMMEAPGGCERDEISRSACIHGISVWLATAKYPRLARSASIGLCSTERLIGQVVRTHPSSTGWQLSRDGQGGKEILSF